MLWDFVYGAGVMSSVCQGTARLKYESLGGWCHGEELTEKRQGAARRARLSTGRGSQADATVVCSPEEKVFFFQLQCYFQSISGSSFSLFFDHPY